MRTKQIRIKGRHSRYTITEDGRIFETWTGKEVEQFFDGEHYIVYLTEKGEEPESYQVHYLLALAFNMGKVPKSYRIAKFKDDNVHNVHIDNIYLTTLEEKYRIFAERTLETERLLTEEQWVPYYGRPDLLVSESGKIVNIENGRNKKCYKGNKVVQGYNMIKLNRQNEVRYVDRVVWESFNRKLVPRGYEIEHIDGNKLNDHYKNLRVVKSKDFSRALYSDGSVVDLPIKQYTLAGEYIRTFADPIEAAAHTGIPFGRIEEAAMKYLSAGTFYWLREDDPNPIEKSIYNNVPPGLVQIKEYPNLYANKEKKLLYHKRPPNFDKGNGYTYCRNYLDKKGRVYGNFMVNRRERRYYY